mgnify:CR=1 FL=1
MSGEYEHPYLPPQHPKDEEETRVIKRFEVRKKAIELTKQWVESIQQGDPLTIDYDVFTRKREEIEKDLIVQPENRDVSDIIIGGAGVPILPEGSRLLYWQYIVWDRTPPTS